MDENGNDHLRFLRVGGVETEKAESKGENRRRLSLRGRCGGGEARGGVGGGECKEAKSEG